MTFMDLGGTQHVGRGAPRSEYLHIRLSLILFRAAHLSTYLKFPSALKVVGRLHLGNYPNIDYIHSFHSLDDTGSIDRLGGKYER